MNSKKVNKLKKVKTYLGEDISLAKPKTAKDVVPLLKEKHDHGDRATTPKRPSITTIHPSIVQLLHTIHTSEEKQSSTVPNKLSTKEFQLLQNVASPSTSDKIAVKRCVLESTARGAHVTAIAAMERYVQCHPEEEKKANTTLQEGSLLCVLTDSQKSAKQIQTNIENTYKEVIEVLVLGEDKFPKIETTIPAPAEDGVFQGKVTIIVASLDSFLLVEKRSAIWKYVGALVLSLSANTTKKGLQCGFIAELEKRQTEKKITDLCDHRWNCLSHVTSVSVMLSVNDTSAEKKDLQNILLHPLLNYLTVYTPSGNDTKKEENTTKKKQTDVTTTDNNKVYYTVCEGMNRFLFLYSLVKGMCNPTQDSTEANNSLVIHVNTKDMCFYLFNVLQHFVYNNEGELGSLSLFNNHTTTDSRKIFVLSDYEGESQYSAVKNEKERLSLCKKFDALVENKNNIVLLITHYGLLPKKGKTLLQYDILVEIQQYAHFLKHKVFLRSGPSATENNNGLQKEEHAISRKRSRSLSPTPKSASQNSSTSAVTNDYQYVFLLLRPNEEPGALQILQPTCGAHHLSLAPLPYTQGWVKFGLVAERVKELNKTVFVIHNSAFHAYRETMRVYCTVGPKSVYDVKTVGEKKEKGHKGVNLLKVAEEFGFTDIPLLDLRLKETEFRPTQDYVRAAFKKGKAERRQYKQFAQENIFGEAPEEHVVDE
ncbi:hypothetical protein AGDE_09816 [Angomonas deanei]|uniref:Uncharacterized protein n=1 Tax=Angomonas deanei TaxID=59799 RepID=A0A7G2C2N7_9TRYP|nr:hypothetical protein AGDE_09816 [Angomonas deanei]CAD2213919.1 hypothetical protein, conserved [Angomonas deanei]|eukprot:EPY29795.1 hypothetical protein AGDE_09816 [Angomonas deanei]